MTVVCALKNAKAKNSIIDYLITYGGGHDGFSELIKIYGYLGNKDICLETFHKMMDCIELCYARMSTIFVHRDLATLGKYNVMFYPSTEFGYPNSLVRDICP